MTSLPESNSADERSIKNESYYWYRGEKITLYETSNKVFAIFDKTSIGELYDPITRSTSTRSFTTKPYHTSKRILNTDVDPEYIFWAKVDKDIVSANASNILYSAPYFLTETGKEKGKTTASIHGLNVPCTHAIQNRARNRNGSNTHVFTVASTHR